MKIMVVGCGSIGLRHISNLLSLGHDVLGFDTSKEQAEKAKKKYGIDIIDTFKIAAGSDADAALICTPNHTHVSIATELVKNGKHVFIEKPLSHNLDGVHDLLAETKRMKRVVMIGCNLRFHPGSRKLKKLLDSNSIGKVFGARMQFGNYLPDWDHPQKDYTKRYSAKASQGGGIILDAIHDVDYACWLFGAPSRMFSFHGRLSQLKIETEDYAEILFRFPDKIVEIHMDYLQRNRVRNYVFIGEKGNIEFDFHTLRIISPKNKPHAIKFNPDKNEMYIEEIKHFLDCVKTGKEPENSVEEAARILALTLKAKQSNERVVRL